MPQLERIRCSNCGKEFEENDAAATVMRCPGIDWGATLVISQAKEFARIRIDRLDAGRSVALRSEFPGTTAAISRVFRPTVARMRLITRYMTERQGN